MSNEVAENLREIASNLLAAANRLDGIDVSADAMRQLPGIDHTGHVHAATDEAVRACQGGTVRVDNGDGTSTYRHATGAVRRLRACVENWPECAEGEYNPRCCRWPKSCSATVYDGLVADADLEPERGA